MNDNGIRDLVIIGGGPGGLTAGIYARRAALDTVLIEKGVAGGQMQNTMEIENWPGDDRVNGADLSDRMRKHAESYGLETVSGTVATIEPGLDYHCIRLEGGTCFQSYAVILATGGSPRKLGIPGEDAYYGKGVSYCAVCDGFFYRGKVVVVVGGGDSALEEALYLAKIANKVYILHRRDAFRGSVILQKRVFRETKIEVRWNTVLTAILANTTGVDNVRFKNVQSGEEGRLDTDGVFIFIGFAPNNALVPAGVRMSADGYVITDERCATTIPGIFAIGDLREKYARQIVTAAADGCVAALAAAHYVEAKKASAI